MLLVNSKILESDRFDDSRSSQSVRLDRWSTRGSSDGQTLILRRAGTWPDEEIAHHDDVQRLIKAQLAEFKLARFTFGAAKEMDEA